MQLFDRLGKPRQKSRIRKRRTPLSSRGGGLALPIPIEGLSTTALTCRSKEADGRHGAPSQSGSVQNCGPWGGDQDAYAATPHRYDHERPRGTRRKEASIPRPGSVGLFPPEGGYKKGNSSIPRYILPRKEGEKLPPTQLLYKGQIRQR